MALVKWDADGRVSAIGINNQCRMHNILGRQGNILNSSTAQNSVNVCCFGRTMPLFQSSSLLWLPKIKHTTYQSSLVSAFWSSDELAIHTNHRFGNSKSYN